MYKHLDFGIDFLWIFQAMEDHGQQTAQKFLGAGGFSRIYATFRFVAKRLFKSPEEGAVRAAQNGQNHPMGGHDIYIPSSLWLFNIAMV